MVRSKELTKVLVLAKIGNSMVGIPIRVESTQNSDEPDGEIEDYIEDVDSESKSSAKRESFNTSNFRAEVNGKLEMICGQNVPLRRLRADLFAEFGNASVCLFMFGQKTSLELVQAKITELVDQNFVVDVAIAAEMKSPANEFFACGFVETLQKQSFSMFGSKFASNILVKDPVVVSKYIRDGTRICVYNTLQHSRSGTKTGLKLNVEEEINGFYLVSDNKFHQKLLKSVYVNVRLIQDKIVRGLSSGTSLRYELYCSLEEKSLEQFKTAMKELIKENVAKVVKANTRDVIRYVQSTGRIMQHLAATTSTQIRFSKWLVSYLMYHQWINTMFVYQNLTVNFMESNRGFGLNAEMFDSENKVTSSVVEAGLFSMLNSLKSYIHIGHFEAFKLFGMILSYEEISNLNPKYCDSVASNFQRYKII